MPLLRLSLVTQTLINLLQRVITSSPEWPAAAVLTVSPEPPDRLAGDHTLGLYLYHAIEDPSMRSLPPVGDSSESASRAPMSLLLYYLLTGHSDLDGSGALEEQFMVGLAMKAFRDIPFLDENTAVAGVQLMPASIRGRGNRFIVSPRIVQPTEAVTYWTAGQRPMRLAVHYEVSAVQLEPDPPPRRASRVLSYHVVPVVGPAPRLTASESHITFLVPGEPTSRVVDMRPAEAAIGDRVTFIGGGLAGDEVELMLEHPSWPGPVPVDSMGWGVVAESSRVGATVAATTGTQIVLPGIYAASISVTTLLPQPDGSVRRVSARSTVTPFSVAPRALLGAPSANGRLTVTGGRFDQTDLPGDQIQVFAGPARIERLEAGLTAPGQFRVIDAEHLQVRLPAGLTAGSSVPIRIVVRGIESAPAWVVAP